jgi:hypothetical protein
LSERVVAGFGFGDESNEPVEEFGGPPSRLFHRVEEVGKAVEEEER